MTKQPSVLHEVNHLNRRALIRLLGARGLSHLVKPGISAEEPLALVKLFDRKILNGWIQSENNATSLSTGGITDTAALAGKLANGTAAVSVFLRSGLDTSLRANLAAYSPSAENAKSMLHPSSVEQVYRKAHERCAPVAGGVPKASVIQELVTAWRVLRKWGRR
jgi:hypothetical protein